MRNILPVTSHLIAYFKISSSTSCILLGKSFPSSILSTIGVGAS